MMIAVTASVPWHGFRDSESRCVICGESRSLLYCICCSQEVHRDCAAAVGCRGAADTDWAEMFRDAAAEDIETMGEHELIAVRIEIDDEKRGVL
jgi:hypothetical protein